MLRISDTEYFYVFVEPGVIIACDFLLIN